MRDQRSEVIPYYAEVSSFLEISTLQLANHRHDCVPLRKSK